MLLCGVVSLEAKWQADLGNGNYRNPIIHADYSDPDVVRVGDDYYMTASSFNCAPGLPILHSTDLVNWRLVNNALTTIIPEEQFAKPAHGKGVWAPSIRYHDSRYYIFWGDPDQGVYCISTSDPRGEWSSPQLVMAGQGIIDPTPLWDDDGRLYLAHSWAGSRAAITSILSVVELDPESITPISGEVLVYDGHGIDHTVEGPKFYKRNGYYYIFAPAGGVATGWQLVLRSKNVYGPYERRMVMSQGESAINGPHQGGWVEDVEGDSWFMHFQDCAAYGRIVHLQPMVWGADDWCVIGEDRDGDGCGTPVATWRKPASRVASEICEPATSDSFQGSTISPQWQWHANYQSWWAMPNPGAESLRLYCIAQDEGWSNLWDSPNLLLQKLPAPSFTATTKMRVTLNEGDRIGLLMMGVDYAAIEVAKVDGRVVVRRVEALEADKGVAESFVEGRLLESDSFEVWFRCVVEEGAKCRFEYSLNGRRFVALGERFDISVGRWIGAKIGFYALSDRWHYDRGRADISLFEIR